MLDMYDRCNVLNLRYVLHVAREGFREPVMKKLADVASIIVTDMILSTMVNLGTLCRQIK